jgi:hypothetical protein
VALLVVAGLLAQGIHPGALCGQDGDAPRLRFGGQLGGTPPSFGTARYRVAGRPIDTDGRDGMQLVFDGRLSAAWLAQKWLALGAELGLVDWHTDYLEDAAHERSIAFSLALAPELRLQLGRRTRAPSLLVTPRAGVLFSRLSGSLHSEVLESERSGYGGVAGAGLGLEIPFVDRFGMRVELAYEAMILKHRVQLHGLGHETRRFIIMRPLFMIGLWWKT